jgi:hypothetical protein
MKSLKVVLPFLLAASVLTVASPSASAVAPPDGYYDCNSGRYISSSSVSNSYRILSGELRFGAECGGDVFIADGVTSIGNDAFSFQSRNPITSVRIPNTVTSIGYFAFENTSSLTTVTFEVGSQLDLIKDFAFFRSGIRSIILPSSVTRIENLAFSNTRLTSLTIPDSVTSLGYDAFSILDSLTQYTYCGTTLTQDQLNDAGLTGKRRISVCSIAGLSSAFSSASSYDGRFTVQVSNYDSAFTYAVTSSVGQASINSTGLVTVTGLRPDQSVTVTMTTTRSGYDTTTASVTGRSQVAPMLPGTKPVVTITDSSIMCTIGSYSATPTSSAFSLFVDGKHISTIFSALGDYLPDWIIPWATSSTITRTATLTGATWTIADDYKGKSITCATLAYSKNAIGFTASQALVAR